MNENKFEFVARPSRPSIGKGAPSISMMAWLTTILQSIFSNALRLQAMMILPVFLICCDLADFFSAEKKIRKRFFLRREIFLFVNFVVGDLADFVGTKKKCAKFIHRCTVLFSVMDSRRIFQLRGGNFPFPLPPP